MRPLTELADEFIEAYFNGSIVSITSSENELNQSTLHHLNKDQLSSIDQANNNLITNIIPKYLKANQKEREDLSLEIVISVIGLRMIGILRNNPETHKDLEYLRIRVNDLERENETLQNKIAGDYVIMQKQDEMINDFRKGKDMGIS